MSAADDFQELPLDPRETLRDAIAAHQVAVDAEAKAQGAVEAAGLFAKIARSGVEAFGDLEAELAAEAASSVGQVQPGQPVSITLSAGLKDRLDARAAALDQERFAQAGLAKLSAVLANAQAETLRCLTARDASAAAVIEAAMGDLAAQVLDAEEICLGLRIKLNSARDLWLNAARLKLDPATIKALGLPSARERIGAFNSPEFLRAREATGAWTRFFQTLKSDPGASVEF
ncbi:MAG: hypothetical protein ABSA13_19430 [Beijerinckiaceae bacterium]|jgi:hypothetical protein